MATVGRHLQKIPEKPYSDDITDHLLSTKEMDIQSYREYRKLPSTERWNFLVRKMSQNSRRNPNYYPELSLVFLEKFKTDYNKLYEDCSKAGGFPRFPMYYLKRNNIVTGIRDKLLELDADGILLIYGMFGYGKSFLLLEALSDPIIRLYFNYHIFWVNLREQDTMELLWTLYNQAVVLTNRPRFSQCPNEKSKLKNELIEIFIQLRNPLLVIDKASFRSFKDLWPDFDLKCKTVITSKHKLEIDVRNLMLLNVKHAFTQEETIALYSPHFNQVHDFKERMEDIHSLCSGHPMLLSLILVHLLDHKEDANVRSDVWKNVITKFKTGDFKLNDFNHSDITKKIDMCLDTIVPENLKDNFYRLVVFKEEVNIKPEVLEILFGMDRNQVHALMLQFVNRSLVVRFHNGESYIYGVHNIFVKYLHKKCSRESKRSYHRRLIDGYKKISEGNFAKLPNDNYSYQFIAYHLKNAEYYDHFSIYLDPRFLEQKIKVAGVWDTLGDFDKYSECITKKDQGLKMKVKSLKEFVELFGPDLQNYPTTDFLQCALQLDDDARREIYQNALQEARTSQKLYFEIQCFNPNFSNINNFNISDEITTACFIDNSDRIAYGTARGDVKIYDLRYEKVMDVFSGHSAAVKSLKINTTNTHFLSVDEGGKVFLWRINKSNSRNTTENAPRSTFPESPKFKQAPWHNITSTEHKRLSIGEFKVKMDELVSAAFTNDFTNNRSLNIIATGTKLGKIVLWNTKTGMEIDSTGEQGEDRQALNVVFSEKDTYVVFSCKTYIFIYKNNAGKLSYYTKLDSNYDIKQLILEDTKLFAISSEEIIMFENTRYFYKNRRQVQFMTEQRLNSKIVCAIKTHDHKYLIVSGDNKHITVWGIEQQNKVYTFRNKGLARSFDILFEPNNNLYILLIRSNNNNLQKCNIQSDGTGPNVPSSPTADITWYNSDPHTAVVSPRNKIKVFQRTHLILTKDTEKLIVTAICMSRNMNKIYCGLNNGEVKLCDINNLREVVLENFDSAITSLTCFHEESGNDLITEYLSITCQDDTLAIRDNSKIIYNMTRTSPRVFYHRDKQFFIIDKKGTVYKNMHTWFQFTGDVEDNEVTAATISPNGTHLAICITNRGRFTLDILIADSSTTDMVDTRMILEKQASSVCFSHDNTVLIIGMVSGEIQMNKLFEGNPITLVLHDAPVEHLFCSQSILVSVGNFIAFWNLNERSMDSLTDVVDRVCRGDERGCSNAKKYLKSSVKLQARVKTIAPSVDFKSFAAVDVAGRVYLMNEVLPDS